MPGLFGEGGASIMSAAESLATMPLSPPPAPIGPPAEFMTVGNMPLTSPMPAPAPFEFSLPGGMPLSGPPVPGPGLDMAEIIAGPVAAPVTVLAPAIQVSPTDLSAPVIFTDRGDHA